MRLLRLHLLAFGPFTGQVLDFGSTPQPLVLVHGPNEAGKSSALRAVSDLRFGIPQQSRDNFVHPHPSMRVGGIFEDSEGRQHALIRRKGRGATLLLADFTRAEPEGDAAPPELEALLTSGLTREEHDLSFALDHKRLRDGGKALLAGEGEIGAALFEASAGVRSIPQLLERMDNSARQFFMPGTRARNARINEALRDYDDHHTAYRQALVRPARWSELFRAHQSALTALAALEEQRRDLHARMLLLGELRAVAPLLRSLDQAARTLNELRDSPTLDPDAAEHRVAAQSGLLAASEGAAADAAEAAQQRRRIEAIVQDPGVLALSGAIRRLASASETLDRHRAEHDDAVARLDEERVRVSGLAAGIDPDATAAEVADRVPPPSKRAAIEALVRSAELARQGLDRHREAARNREREAIATTRAPLPAPQARAALRAAQAELARNDETIRRLADLPMRIRAAERQLKACLEDAGLGDEAAMLRARPMLDDSIDLALDAQRRNATRIDERRQRIAEIDKALQEAVQRRDRLLEHGAVPTADALARARAERDETWSLVRATYIDGTRPMPDTFSGENPLPERYEHAVTGADRLADALAADHERAAELQSALRAIATLQTDRESLENELSVIAAEDSEREAAWRGLLDAASLPHLAPAALRQWQARLGDARDAAEEASALRDEREHALGLERHLAATLHRAVLATGLAAPAPDAPLGTLAAIAVQIDEEIRSREKQLDTEAGARDQHAREGQRMAAQEGDLARALEAAEAALRPALAALGLPADAPLPSVRARLDEFEALSGAQERLLRAQTRQRQAQDALAVLEDAARSIATALGDPAPHDVRIYAERVAERLGAAQAAAASLALARQALERAVESLGEHERASQAYQQRLATLCSAARIDTPALLPEAEERSRRRRDAQARFDAASVQLAQASRRPSEELRALLADCDAAALDAEEATCAQEQTRLDEALRDARHSEEQARQALQAIDGADTAAAQREAMARAAARVRASMAPWIRSRLAHSLLTEALGRFRDRAQGPMLAAASRYFERMTAGEFTRLLGDDSGDRPMLLALRRDGTRLHVEGMSEGTLDQLYLALRLAALALRRAARVDLPVLLDDVLMTSDDRRAALMLEALADFSQEGQVIVFTHHRHLVELARARLPADRLAVLELPVTSDAR